MKMGEKASTSNCAAYQAVTETADTEQPQEMHQVRLQLAAGSSVLLLSTALD